MNLEHSLDDIDGHKDVVDALQDLPGRGVRGQELGDGAPSVDGDDSKEGPLEDGQVDEEVGYEAESASGGREGFRRRLLLSRLQQPLTLCVCVCECV